MRYLDIINGKIPLSAWTSKTPEQIKAESRLYNQNTEWPGNAEQIERSKLSKLIEIINKAKIF